MDFSLFHKRLKQMESFHQKWSGFPCFLNKMRAKAWQPIIKIPVDKIVGV